MSAHNGTPEQRDPRLMREMFHTISPRYDFITRAFSFGMDAGWKRDGVARAGLPKRAVVLDLAAGTGDFSKLVAAQSPNARPIAVDLTPKMLRLARDTGVERAVCADAMRLPFPADTFDAAFVGYGLRNFPKLGEALAEIRRVLKPRGLLICLDFFLPRVSLLRRAYLGYLYLQGFCWGWLLHRRPRIYTYIPDSLVGFVTIDQYQDLLASHGYQPLRAHRYIFGGIGVVTAERSDTVAQSGGNR